MVGTLVQHKLITKAAANQTYLFTTTYKRISLTFNIFEFLYKEVM